MNTPLKITFGFARKLNASAHGGIDYESIDFSAFVDIPYDSTLSLVENHAAAKEELDALYNKLKDEAIARITEPVTPVTVATKPKSPFASRGK
jgi:hypothetical protein